MPATTMPMMACAASSPSGVAANPSKCTVPPPSGNICAATKTVQTTFASSAMTAATTWTIMVERRRRVADAMVRQSVI